MGITNSNKVINTDRIACDGALRVTLALTAAPDIVSNPTDTVIPGWDRKPPKEGETSLIRIASLIYRQSSWMVGI